MVASVSWSIPGNPGTDRCTIKSKVAGVSTIQLAVSTSNTGGNPVAPVYYDPTGLVTTDGLITHRPTGLAPDTDYYAKLATSPGSFIGDPVHFKTLPAPGNPFTRKIVLVSCQKNANQSETQIGWEDILAWGPHDIFMTGDEHYLGGGLSSSDPWQTHMAKWASQLSGLPTMRQAWAAANFYILGDDHSFSSDNGDSNSSTATGLVRRVGIDAMQRVFPMYPLADTRSQANKRGLYGSYMIGDNVRVIFADGETLDRSLAADTDNGSKTFFGTEQDTWLRDLLVQPAAVNIIVTGKALLGDQENDAAMADKPPNYSAHRAALAQFITDNQTTDGNPIEVYWWGGDRHANGYISKTNNPIIAGSPSALSSGIEQHSLDRHSGEDYDDDFGFGDHTLDIPVVQYLQITLTDDPGSTGTGTVSVRVLSRETHNTFVSGSETSPSGWFLEDGFDHTDTWTYDSEITGGGGNFINLYLQGDINPPVDGTILLQNQSLVRTYRWTDSRGNTVQPSTIIDPDRYSGSLPLGTIRPLQFRLGMARPVITYGRGLVFSTTPLSITSGRISLKVPAAPGAGSLSGFGVWPLGVHDPDEFYVESTTQNSDLGGLGKNWTRHNATFAVGRGFNKYPKATYIGVGGRINSIPNNNQHYLKMVQLEMAALDGTVYPTPYTQAREVQTIVHPDRLNFSLNPALENDKNNWNALNHGGGIDRVPDGGGWAAQVSIPAGEEVTIHHLLESMVIGRRYTASFFVYAPGRSEVSFEVIGGDIVYQHTYAQTKNNEPDKVKNRVFPYRRIWVVFDATSTEVNVNLIPTSVEA